jgi:acyl carrier protein
MDIEAVVTTFILDEVPDAAGRDGLDPDESLLRSGVLDSLLILKLMEFVEEQFHITVEDGEVVPGNFETVHRIRTFVERKQQENLQ